MKDMHTIRTIASSLVLALVGCTNPNEEYIETIRLHIKTEANGVEMNYESLEFKWIDTLHVHEQVTALTQLYADNLKAVIGLETFIKDDFIPGKVFSKNYLTLDRFKQLRDWEKIIRGVPFDEEFSDYYAFAFSNRTSSPFISELCDQLEKSDSLIQHFESIEEGNLALLSNVLWYYQRIDYYESNGQPNPIWDTVRSALNDLNAIQQSIDSLSQMDPQQVLEYKAYNAYQVNNPAYNGALQEVKKNYIFNPTFSIIGEEAVPIQN